MKTLSTILLSMLFILSGCATTNTPSQETSSSLDTMQEHLDEILTQLDETENSLNDVTNADESTLEDAYESFTDDVSQTEDMKNDFEDLADDVRQNSSEYLTKWENEVNNYENNQLRRGSEQRLGEIRQALSSVRNNSGSVTRAMEDYLSDLNEIDSYLNNDLTISGVEAVYSLSQNMEDSGDNLRQEINTLQQSVTDAKEEMGEGDPKTKE